MIFLRIWQVFFEHNYLRFKIEHKNTNKKMINNLNVRISETSLILLILHSNPQNKICKAYIGLKNERFSDFVLFYQSTFFLLSHKNDTIINTTSQ